MYISSEISTKGHNDNAGLGKGWWKGDFVRADFLFMYFFYVFRCTLDEADYVWRVYVCVPVRVYFSVRSDEAYSGLLATG